MRLARAYDEAGDDPIPPSLVKRRARDAHLFKRLATAVGKYWTCKRAPNHAFEALECLGGTGYVEESGMPRLYREAPLASIWEGSGNVISLDVLRALVRTPRSLEVFLARAEASAGRRPAPGRPRREAGVAVHRRSRDARVTRAPRGRVDGSVPAGLAARAPRARRRSPTRSAPRAWAATGAWSTGRCPRASDFEAIIARSRPQA